MSFHLKKRLMLYDNWLLNYQFFPFYSLLSMIKTYKIHKSVTNCPMTSIFFLNERRGKELSNGVNLNIIALLVLKIGRR